MAETIQDLQSKLLSYEQNGAAKLYYALNRKMNEMADILNNTKLSGLALDDPKDKTFERLKVLWNDSSTIALAVKGLGDAIGVTGDETGDINKKVFRLRTTPETIADVLGNTAGKMS